MAEKSEFVDTISAATRQTKARRATPLVIERVDKEQSRLSHWPPKGWADWRMETLTPWKLKPWKTGD
ncbi:hypothetical protein [Bradyrhizobium sp.]|jgi:hypothetical protein|uniref:hypothetical protein n=1 Tax=Bradyrhizobium sp. TaxID=376 RepID=UPI003C179277